MQSEEWIQGTKSCVEGKSNAKGIVILQRNRVNLNVQIKIISDCIPSYLAKSDFWEVEVQFFVIIQTWLGAPQFDLEISHLS